MVTDRTLDDLSDEEYEDYCNNPEDYEDITENTISDMLDMMFPNGTNDDE